MQNMGTFGSGASARLAQPSKEANCLVPQRTHLVARGFKIFLRYSERADLASLRRQGSASLA